MGKKYKVLILLFILFFVSSTGILLLADTTTAVANLKYVSGTITPSYEVGLSLSEIKNGTDPVTPVDANISLTTESVTNADDSTTIQGKNNIIWAYWKVVYPNTKLDLKLRADGPLSTEDGEKSINWRIYYYNDAGTSIDVINSADETGISSIAGEGQTIMSKAENVQRITDSEHLYIEAKLDTDDYNGYLAVPYEANLYVEMVVGS